MYKNFKSSFIKIVLGMFLSIAPGVYGQDGIAGNAHLQKAIIAQCTWGAGVAYRIAIIKVTTGDDYNTFQKKVDKYWPSKDLDKWREKVKIVGLWVYKKDFSNPNVVGSMYFRECLASYREQLWVNPTPHKKGNKHELEPL